MSFRRAALPLLAGFALAAAQDAAPLAESRRALQTLEKDRAAERAKVDDGPGLRLALPAIAQPASETPVAAPATPAAPEPSRGGARNWLVDGFDSLERGRDATKDEAEPLDPNAPDHFVRLYRRQRSAGEPARRPVDEERGEAGGGGVGEAMKPFLNDWLSGSPVAEALRTVVGRGSDSRFGREEPDALGGEPMRAPPDSRTAILGSPAGEGSLPLPSVAPQAGAATNPFIAALGLDRANVAAPAPSASTVPAPAPVAWTPPESPTPEVRRPPPRPDDEARKYFPQLRKF